MRTPEQLGDLDQITATRETFRRLRDASVTIVDYRQVFLDFPWLAEGRSIVEARDKADRWLLENAAVISVTQCEQTTVNSKIDVVPGAEVFGARPPAHGRSAILQTSGPDAGGNSLISVKGLGVPKLAKPTLERQQNGLLPLHCALYEFMMHKLVSNAFRYSGSAHRVLPAYAVIDTGFDEIDLNDGPSRPAGLLVRRAHLRQQYGLDLPRFGSAQQLAVADAEFVLRHFGITSNSTSPWMSIARTSRGIDIRGSVSTRHLVAAGDVNKLVSLIGDRSFAEFDGISLQYTENFDWAAGGLELVDLHYAVRSRFDLPLVSTVCDRLLAVGGVINVDHADFVQPLPTLVSPVLLKRRPTTDEANRLMLSDGQDEDGGVLVCMDVARSVRRSGRESTEIIFDLIREIADYWGRELSAISSFSRRPTARESI